MIVVVIAAPRVGATLAVAPTSVLMPKLYVFVGRGHDPADQVAMIEWLVEWYRVPSDCKS